MLFNSLHFAFFFPIVIVLYFTLAQRFRKYLLLTASYYFYMCWKVEYIFLILLSTSIDYFATRRMHKSKNKKKYLIISLISNLGILFGFKYFNFINESLHAVFQSANILYTVPNLKVLIPVGISFYTFQTLSYTIDVYRGKIKPEKDFISFAIYVSFFPQLVAGPIERAGRLLPQLKEKYNFDYNRITSGLKLMFLGFVKKILIADNLAEYVNILFSNPENYNGFNIIIISFFFSWQIYCDFSGYSDIAVGAARIMGFNLMENFRQPFTARSLSELWQRWHISLTSWFKDYIYFPLGGNRVKFRRWCFNIFLIFLISGLWHGAAWTFVIFGILNAFFLIIGAVTSPLRKRIFAGIENTRFQFLHKLSEQIFAFSLFSVSLFFFRAESIDDAFILIKKISLIKFQNLTLQFDKLGLLINFALIFLLVIIQYIEKKQNIVECISSKPPLIRWSIYIFMSLLLLTFGNFGLKEFIYFQF